MAFPSATPGRNFPDWETFGGCDLNWEVRLNLIRTCQAADEILDKLPRAVPWRILCHVDIVGRTVWGDEVEAAHRQGRALLLEIGGQEHRVMVPRVGPAAPELMTQDERAHYDAGYRDAEIQIAKDYEAAIPKLQAEVWAEVSQIIGAPVTCGNDLRALTTPSPSSFEDDVFDVFVDEVVVPVDEPAPPPRGPHNKKTK